jgi:hypothetical protein
MKSRNLVMLLCVACSGMALAQNAPAPAPTASGTNPPAPQSVAPPSAPAKFSAAELEKMAMPIALHPDPLISIILPASAYPLEIVQAARFVKDTNNIPKVDQQPWDDNVKAVAKFPDLIAKMDTDLNWTMDLGKAFIDQPKELMDTIQDLRSKAQKAGTLRTSEQQVVTVTNTVVIQTNTTEVVYVTNQIVQVQPANPQVVYVPSYPSTVYYPPPYYVYDPWAPLVTFGVGMAMGAIIANNCDWHGGCVWWGGGHSDVDIDIDNDINIDRNFNSDRNVDRNRNQSGNRANTQQKWQPNQSRLQSSGATASAQSREARGWGTGSGQTGPRSNFSSVGSGRPTQQAAGRPSVGNQPARTPGGSGNTWSSPSGSRSPSSPIAAARPQPSASRQPASNPSRPTQSPSVNRPSSSSSAFGGVSNGGGARNMSSRGAASRGGGGGGRGGGGRGR